MWHKHADVFQCHRMLPATRNPEVNSLESTTQPKIAMQDQLETHKLLSDIPCINQTQQEELCVRVLSVFFENFLPTLTLMTEFFSDQMASPLIAERFLNVEVEEINLSMCASSSPFAQILLL